MEAHPLYSVYMSSQKIYCENTYKKRVTTSLEGCRSSAAPAENVNVVYYLSDAALQSVTDLTFILLQSSFSGLCEKLLFFFFTSILLLCFMLL